MFSFCLSLRHDSVTWRGACPSRLSHECLFYLSESPRPLRSRWSEHWEERTARREEEASTWPDPNLPTCRSWRGGSGRSSPPKSSRPRRCDCRTKTVTQSDVWQVKSFRGDEKALVILWRKAGDKWRDVSIWKTYDLECWEIKPLTTLKGMPDCFCRDQSILKIISSCLQMDKDWMELSGS